MEDWMKLPVTQLKRLVKSRAGRIAELQMELKVIEGIIESKIRSGDFSGKELPKKDVPSKTEQRPEPQKEQKPQAPQEEAHKPQEPLIRPSQAAQEQSLGGEEKKHPGFDKKEEKPKSPNPHAFKEID